MLVEHTLAGLLQDFCGPAVRADVKVTGLALDSRKVQAGDLFLAVAGTRTHGMQHARQAIALGAVAVAWE
ncbi:MAG: Mur ligase domain-containing protein, partial [Gammaproteobacteria bacterium]|nr:Mur ligase domain-containing protein [Gammaproteobacteria bacterium]